jgi:His-Xaa-Ser system radical SAM maturase HxsC
MLLKTKGVPYRIARPIVAKVTRNPSTPSANSALIVEERFPSGGVDSFRAVLTNRPLEDTRVTMPVIHSVSNFDHLAEGDIVVINTDGVINTIYRVGSHQNFLLVTERCNSNCLMCSQPPKDRNDIPYLFDVCKELVPLIPKDAHEIGITGGEPTILGDLFFDLLQLIKSELPNTEVHCLTNGRSFAWNKMALKLGEMNYNKLMLGIPLYSDYYRVHDYIVQAKNAFDQTMQGLYNLAEQHQRIEIRIVLHKQSIPRLTKLAHYIYRNLPFVEHVAFMGLEYQGYTPHNIDKLWIEPKEYVNDLVEATDFLSDRGLNVSVYNLPLCVMPRELWKYNKKSISDWKNIYLEECTKCVLSSDCGGLFISNEKILRKYVKAFDAAPRRSHHLVKQG